MSAMPTTVLDLISLYITTGSPAALEINELTLEGTTLLAWSAACPNRHRHLVQARGLRLISMATFRIGVRRRRERAELLVEIAGLRATLRNMNRGHSNFMRALDDALARSEDDDGLDMVPRVRMLVRNLMIERETLAMLLSAHPTLREEAGRLRIDAEDTFPEVSDDDS
jgi:hypothetical protein